MDLPKPEDRPARWLQDTDLNQTLVIAAVELKDELVIVQYTTPLQEKCRRELKLTSPEYAFLYNQLNEGDWIGAKVVYAKKNGFRTPISAEY